MNSFDGYKTREEMTKREQADDDKGTALYEGIVELCDDFKKAGGADIEIVHSVVGILVDHCEGEAKRHRVSLRCYLLEILEDAADNIDAAFHEHPDNYRTTFEANEGRLARNSASYGDALTRTYGGAYQLHIGSEPPKEEPQKDRTHQVLDKIWQAVKDARASQ